MEDSSESRFWSALKNFFTGKSQNQLEKIIVNAIEENDIPLYTGKMLLNILKLEKLQIKDIMVPRTDIDCVEENSSIEDLAKIIIKNGHSRIPIYRENKDQIIGVIHAKDILPLILDSEKNFKQKIKDLKDILRPPLFIPETKNVKEMLLEFQNKRVHLAIAIDEYGGTAGLVTLEDILEEIVGEIEDEHDLPKPEEIRKIDKNKFLVSGRVTLEELKEKLGIELKSEHVETLGGFLIEFSGKVPQPGEKFKIKDWDFEIKEADKKHIFTVMITHLS